jgi:hypothetical protein
MNHCPARLTHVLAHSRPPPRGAQRAFHARCLPFTHIQSLHRPPPLLSSLYTQAVPLLWVGTPTGSPHPTEPTPRPLQGTSRRESLLPISRAESGISYGGRGGDGGGEQGGATICGEKMVRQRELLRIPSSQAASPKFCRHASNALNAGAFRRAHSLEAVHLSESSRAPTNCLTRPLALSAPRLPRNAVTFWSWDICTGVSSHLYAAPFFLSPYTARAASLLPVRPVLARCTDQCDSGHGCSTLSPN